MCKIKTNPGSTKVCVYTTLFLPNPGSTRVEPTSGGGLTLQASKKKLLHEALREWINRTTPPPPPPSSSTFDTIHLIDLKFGTYNKLHLYFQLNGTTLCLIGFHGNNNQINDVTGGRHLGFSNFQILFKFPHLYLRRTGKLHLAVEIHEIGRIRCEVVSI